MKNLFLRLILTIFLISTLNAKEGNNELDNVLSLVSTISKTIHLLQQERGISCGFISSKGTKFGKKLTQVKKESDLKIQALYELIQKNEKTLHKYISKKEYGLFKDTLNEIAKTRENVKNINFNFATTFVNYTHAISFMLTEITDISDKLKNKDMKNKLYAYSILLMYKESVGQKRAILSALFSHKKFSKEIFEYYLTSDIQEKIYLKSFLHAVDEKTKEQFLKIINNKTFKEVAKYEKSAKERFYGKSNNINPEEWFEAATKKIAYIEFIENKIFDDMLKLAKKINSQKILKLTKKEKEWIDTHIVRVGAENRKPIIFSTNGKDIQGISADIFKKIAKLSQLRYEVVSDDLNKLLKGLEKNGNIDVIPNTYEINQKAKKGLLSKQYLKIKGALYIAKTNHYIRSLKDLSGKKLAIVSGDATAKKVKERFPDIIIVKTRNLDESIDKVLNGSVDALYDTKLAVGYKIRTEFISGLQYIPVKELKEQNLYFYINKNDPVLLGIINKSLDLISKKEIDDIVRKWTNVTVQKSIDYMLLTKIIAVVLIILIYIAWNNHKLKVANKNLEDSLHLLKEYQDVVDASTIVSKTDINGKITYINKTFCDISQYSKDELLGKPHNIVRHPDTPKEVFANLWHTIKDKKQIWQGLIKNRKKDGGSYYVKTTIKPILDRNGNIVEFIAIRQDITDIMNPYKQLVDTINSTKNPLLIYMKLDEFNIIKELFDTKTIEMIEDKLADIIYKKFPDDFQAKKVYQLGDGEFAIVLQEEILGDFVHFISEIKRFQQCIKDEVIDLGNFVYDVALLVSISYSDENILEDVKLGIEYLQKNKESFIVANHFAAKKRRAIQKNMQTLTMIKNAINKHKIVSYFQPIIDNKTKKIAKYESLVRLIDDDGKIVTPFFFLDIAKKGKYYTQITKIVLQNSFEALKRTNKDISINLSALDIELGHIRNEIFSLLQNYKDDAKRIVFELLEDESVKDISVIHSFISEVKKYGVKIAIDDFGSGYSNFERLLEYQPDILKIDGSLIKNIENDAYSLSIVKTIVTFAKEQKLQLVAEFVENEAIYNILNDLGIDFSQGYYFAKPEPLEKLEELELNSQSNLKKA